jgi:hypothetical protein
MNNVLKKRLQYFFLTLASACIEKSTHGGQRTQELGCFHKSAPSVLSGRTQFAHAAIPQAIIEAPVTLLSPIIDYRITRPSGVKVKAQIADMPS